MTLETPAPDMTPELTPASEAEIMAPAAPATDTVRSTDREVSDESQTGQSPASRFVPQKGSGVTAATGAEPVPEAAAPVTPKQISRADAARPPDLIDVLQSHVGGTGSIDPQLIQAASPGWKPTGAARRLFRAGGMPAEKALGAITYEHPQMGAKSDMGLDAFGEAINAAAEARKGWRRQFYAEEAQLQTEARQTSKFQRDTTQPIRGTAPLVPEDLNEGDTFELRGKPFKVTRLDYDEDGRVTHLTLDDGAKYGTQEVDGLTLLRMDKGSLESSAAPKVEFLPEETHGAPGILQRLDTLKLDTRGQLHAFGLLPEAWNALIEGVKLAVRGGLKVKDAIDSVLAQWRERGQLPPEFNETGARAWLAQRENPVRVTHSFGGDFKAARAWALNHARGTVHNQMTGLPIEIARPSIEKVLSESAVSKSPNITDHVDALQGLKELLSRAVLEEARAAEKKTGSIGNILRLHSPLEVNGKLYDARLTVREHTNPAGRKFYTYELMELTPGGSETPGGNSVEVPTETPPFPATSDAGRLEPKVTLSAGDVKSSEGERRLGQRIAASPEISEEVKQHITNWTYEKRTNAGDDAVAGGLIKQFGLPAAKELFLHPPEDFPEGLRLRLAGAVARELTAQETQARRAGNDAQAARERLTAEGNSLTLIFF